MCTCQHYGETIRAPILLATNPVSSDRSKHIRVRHLRVRDAVEAEEIALDWIGTKFMLAYGLTKVFP